MVSETYREKIIKWSEEPNGEKYLTIDTKVDFFAKFLFYDYEPTKGPFLNFRRRLEHWLNNVTDEVEQKLLLTLIPRIFYVGSEEFNSLHRTAFNSHVKHWLIDKENLSFEDENYTEKLNSLINKTWFCPVTDSFRINQFYHVNQIKSIHTFRPEWRVLKKFGHSEKVVDYVIANQVKYLVLLEDFVGSGGQSFSPIEFACKLFNECKKLDWEVNILFIPLIICPDGIKQFNTACSVHPNLTFNPVIEVKEFDLINESSAKMDASLKPYVKLIKNNFNKVKGSSTAKELVKIDEFGYKNTGCLTVMFSNTPNNSLPIIYVDSDTWNPLFKRHFRDC